MAEYPRYLTEYPNADSTFPFFMKIDRHKQTHITPHRHDFLELSLFVEGGGVETINGQRHTLKPGTMMMLLPYQIHELQYEPTVLPMMYTCNFDIELLSGSNEADWGFQAWLDAQSEAQAPYIYLDPNGICRMTELFAAMYDEYMSDSPWRKYKLKAMLIEIIVEFDRLRLKSMPLIEKSTAVPVMAGTGSNRKNIWPVIQHIHANYREPLTLTELAQQFHFNATHLSELFKKQLGQNFVHFLHEVRIRHASSLLWSTELPVSAISLEVGFGSLQTFSRIFRQLKDCTPLEYRRKRQA
ncbi:AraC family transcriptional regulator [Paenibacillus qinlingensis]|uniref:AraC-like DNA-binding protein n=1 Tax=Paenibacillus qinlingensis TaxID=1837343 RepID=A0ABU1NWA5_9BACL|nr:AraC family transcriptional regulator [Paenibacillus qinlingensis]MDR6551761.1 AraC-like DNA-binding protein [Paenibacillus qinlingensis]